MCTMLSTGFVCEPQEPRHRELSASGVWFVQSHANAPPDTEWAGHGFMLSKSPPVVGNSGTPCSDTASGGTAIEEPPEADPVLHAGDEPLQMPGMPSAADRPMALLDAVAVVLSHGSQV